MTNVLKAIKNRTIKAFTLIEVLIVFIITSTVILLAMWSYMNVMSYLKSYNQNENINQELALFLDYFNKDMDKAKELLDTRDALQLNYYNQDPIFYEFYNNFVLREQYSYQDTFWVNINTYDYKFEELNEDWVSEIFLEINVSGVNYPLYFYKNYSNQQLFEKYEY